MLGSLSWEAAVCLPARTAHLQLLELMQAFAYAFDQLRKPVAPLTRLLDTAREPKDRASSQMWQQLGHRRGQNSTMNGSKQRLNAQNCCSGYDDRIRRRVLKLEKLGQTSTNGGPQQSLGLAWLLPEFMYSVLRGSCRLQVLRCRTPHTFDQGQLRHGDVQRGLLHGVAYI